MKFEAPFAIRGKTTGKFEEVDPFNPENTLKGYIYRAQGGMYGTLYITHVNDKIMPQVAYGAPKQHYPFGWDKTRWHWPKADEVEVYTKLDGTNVTSYCYTDGHDTFLTYKTRLRPVLGENKYGNFFALWSEVLDMYPEIAKECFDTAFNYSFELYGKRNFILVEYDKPLDTRLLFAIDKQKRVVPPSRLDIDVPKLERVCQYDTSDLHAPENTLEYLYHFHEKQMEEDLEVIYTDEEEKFIEKILGPGDGQVWYFLVDGYAVQIKAKPESVKKVHWAPTGIAFESIYTTCVNALENWDEPTFLNVKELLMEEFPEERVDRVQHKIQNILKQVMDDRLLQNEVTEEYRRVVTPEFNIKMDKGGMMRHMAGVFCQEDKRLGVKIYNFLNRLEE